MLTSESLLAINGKEISEAAKKLTGEEVGQLIGILNEKEDKLRYQAFLLLKERSASGNDVYRYWDTLKEKLKNANSYQRSIGLMLIAANAGWDKEGRMEDTIDDYLLLLKDEKPITVRQCIQSLDNILRYKQNLREKIAENLMTLHLSEIRDTMRKSVLMDILTILSHIRNEEKNDEIDRYILEALSGDILDKKSKKLIEEACSLRVF
jgi:hypothetical protein